MALFSDMSLTTAVLGLLGLFLFTHVVKSVSKFKSTNLPPGPKPLPLIGNLLQVPKTSQWQTFYSWSKKYGPVMSLDMMGQSLIVLSTNRAAMDLLSQKGSQYSDRPRMIVASELATRGLHTLFRNYDSRFRLHQRMGGPLLNPRAARCYQPLQEMESRQLLHDFMEGVKSHGDKGVDPHHTFERTTSSFIYCLLYGYRFRTGYEKEIVEAQQVQEAFFKTTMVGNYIVDTLPFLNHLPRVLAPWKKEGDELYNLEASLHIGNLRKAIKSPGWNMAKSAMASKEAQEMSEPELAFDLGVVADAALDTTAMTLDWFIIAWLNDREWVSKAQRLLDEVVGEDRMPQWEDRSKLLYIDAIVSEILRWRPVVISGVPHFTKTPDTYQDHAIPANSVIIANAYAMSRDETVFGPDTDSFIPERWLETKNSHTDTLKNLPDVGFGFGRRICPGRHIGRNALFCSIVHMLWAFDVEVGVDGVTGEKGVVDPADYTEGLVVRPRPFKAILRPRGQRRRELIRELGNTHGRDYHVVLDDIREEMKIEI